MRAANAHQAASPQPARSATRGAVQPDASRWRRLREWLHYLRVFLRPDVVLIKGRRADGSPLSLLRAGIGDRQTAYFFASHVLAELLAERPLGRAWLWSLPRLARRHGCAFALFRVSAKRAALARTILGRQERDAPHLPAFVSVQLDIADPQRLLRRDSLRSDVRRIGRAGYRAGPSRDRRDLEAFVRDYREPYVRSVHGFGAIGMDFERLFASCSPDCMPDPWVLLKIEHDGRWLAAALLFDAPGRAALMEIGVRDADPTLVRAGVLQAVYWMTLEYFRERGHGEVNLMLTPPFLRSGVMQYKLKYGPRLKPARAGDGFLLLSDRNAEAARRTLLREALLVTSGRGLRVVWFAADEQAAPDPAFVPRERLKAAGIDEVERIVLRP